LFKYKVMRAARPVNAPLLIAVIWLLFKYQIVVLLTGGVGITTRGGD